MLTMTKIFEELFTVALNRIAVSVCHVFSTPNARLSDQLPFMLVNETIGSEESRKQ